MKNPEEERIARNAYHREWCRRNRDKTAAYLRKCLANMPEEKRAKRRKDECERVRQYRKEGRLRDQLRAHSALTKALAKGKIIKPSTCSACCDPKGRIEAHHHNGYAKEHRLDVVWLCRKCHEAAHHYSSVPDQG